ncbi:MAG TPA: LPS assembly protein LptD [Acidobacteriaceae bacterium]|nr:LPS assembly protein LptD [Acidobacteriaceae bacterium]
MARLTIGTVRRREALGLRRVAIASLRSIFFYITITTCAVNFGLLAAQQVTTAAPPAPSAKNGPAPAPQYPDAVLLQTTEGTPISFDAATKTLVGSVATLDGNVTIRFKGRTLRADHIEYDEATGDVTLTGGVIIDGGENDEHIAASHGTFNIHTETGRFYDVTGSISPERRPPVGPVPATARAVYANSNPFLFTARVLTKTGPRDYSFDHGTFTSCQLPKPDWILSAGHFSSDGAKAHAANTVFHLLGVPLLWLPYATHPVDASSRQTGILIPELGINSASKGDTVGEQIYWAINRSTDMTVGTIYYSARGWERTAAIRYRGPGQDFLHANYNALSDRGYLPSGSTVRINQSGTDAVISARKDLVRAAEVQPDGAAGAEQGQTRLAADIEYLSSFPYREAFSSNFNQAASSDVLSDLYAIHERNGMALSLEADRYQGEKLIATPTQAEQQVRIFHAPSLEFATTSHHLGMTPLEWSLDSSMTALKRAQPVRTAGGPLRPFDSGMVGRLDVHPEISLPFHFGGWSSRPSIAGRETFYTRSRLPAQPGSPGLVELPDGLNRADFEAEFDLRPPVIERTFDSGWFRRLFGEDVKHTIEPQLTYRYVSGIDNFPNVLRFDFADVASDTNELEYGGTQRLFLRRTGDRPCHASGSAADAAELLGYAGAQGDEVEAPGEAAGRRDDAEQVCGNREWITWRIAQKFFFNSNFGGAVTTSGPRSILDTTLNFSGISFMTGPRNLSPLVSRLRLRTSEKMDVEWDFDYDTVAGKYTSNNFYADVHWGDPDIRSKQYVFAGLGYARLNAPARSYVEGVVSSVADFNQMRVLLGFGKPTRPGLSAAASAGLDLDLGSVQYGAIQTSYNWNCCGISVEYRKYELGTARNDNGYKFNFTLANIGSAGNLRRSEEVF